LFWMFEPNSAIEDYNHVQSWNLTDEFGNLLYKQNDRVSVGYERPSSVFHSFFMDNQTTSITLTTDPWRSVTMAQYFAVWDTNPPNYCQGVSCGSGACVVVDRGYSCNCTGSGRMPDSTGSCSVSQCNIPQLNKCVNNGTCIDNTPLNPTCNCTGTGFQGEYCEIQVDDCAPAPCAHGVCFDKLLGYFCICNRGYKGANCADVENTDTVLAALVGISLTGVVVSIVLLALIIANVIRVSGSTSASEPNQSQYVYNG